jgi:hypothetical protein
MEERSFPELRVRVAENDGSGDVLYTPRFDMKRRDFEIASPAMVEAADLCFVEFFDWQIHVARDFRVASRSRTA